MAHFFERKDRWGHGLARWTILGMALLAPLALWAVLQIELENDVNSWLPSDDPQAYLLEWSQEHFPSDDNVLVSWDGSTLGDPRLKRLQRNLEGVASAEGERSGGLKQVASVVNPQDLLARMQDQDISRAEAVRRMTGLLVGNGPLKMRLTEAGRQDLAGTRERLLERLRDELRLDATVRRGSPDPSVRRGSPDPAADPTEGLPHAVDGRRPAVARVARSGDRATTVDRATTADRATAPGDRATAEAADFDLEIEWPGMHLRPREVNAVKSLALGLRGGAAMESADQPLVAECFFTPGSPVALSVVLSESGASTPIETVAAIRRAAVDAGIDGDDLRLAGRIVTGAELSNEVNSTGWNPAYPMWQLHKRSLLLVSALLSAGLAFFMLRSLRLALLVLLVANFATLLAVSLVPLTGGSMNMVLMVMPTLLSVLTLSAAIHMVNYWKHAAQRDLRTAVVGACRMARLPCALASVTTAIGMISLLTSPLTPVRDLGLYSAVGCLISLVVVLYGLPALLQYWPGSPPQAAELDDRRWRRLGGFLFRRWKLVSIVCVVAFVACGSGLRYFQTEIKAIRFFSGDSRVVQDYEFLEQNLSGLVPVEMIVRFDTQAQEELDFLQRMELVRGVQDEIRHHPEISGSMSLADFQQVYEPPRDDASLPARLAYNRRLYEMERRIKDPESGATSFVRVVEKPQELETASGRYVSVRAGDELWRITAQVAMMSDYDYADLTGDWNDPHAAPGELNELAASAIAGQPGVDHMLTGMVPLFLRTQQAVLDSLIYSFGLAFAVIAVVMMVLLRNPWAGLLSMLPNLLPVTVVFGLIAWAGLAVDMGTMITASVALGIAVDGTLHLLTWFRAGLRDGLSRSDAIVRALGHCGPAMWQTSAAISLGLLVMVPSDLLLISRFGWLMAALIFLALLADVVLLPALLAGPLGGLMERTFAPVAEPEPLDAAEAEPHPLFVPIASTAGGLD